MLLFGSTTCSVMLKWGSAETLTRRLTSPLRSKNLVSFVMLLDTDKSLTSAQEDTSPSRLACKSDIRLLQMVTFEGKSLTEETHLQNSLKGEVSVQKRLGRESQPEASCQVMKDALGGVPRLLPRHTQVLLQGASQ